MSHTEILKKLFPPKVLIRVGSGGSLKKPDAFVAKHTVLLEGDSSRFKRLAANFKESEDVTVSNIAVGGKSGSATFHTLSVDSESGLLDAKALTALWPNIEILEERNVDVVSLDALFENGAIQSVTQEDCNWLELTCLQAGEVLEGAVQLLAKLDVVICRLVLVEQEKGTPLYSSSYAAISPFLQKQGFLEVHRELDRNTAIGIVAFAREPAHGLAATEKELERIRSENEALQKAFEKTSQEQESISVERDEALIELKSVSAALELATKSLSAQSDEIHNELELKNKEIENIKDHKRSVEEVLKALQQEHELALSQRDEALATNNEAQSRIKDAETKLEKQMQELEQELANAKEEVDRADKKKAIAENNLEELRAKYRKTAQSLLEKEEQLVKLGGELAPLIEAFADTTAANNGKQSKEPKQKASGTQER